MSLMEVFKDAVKPQSVKDMENIKKAGDALKKLKTHSQDEIVDEVHGIVKKGWLERVEKELKWDLKNYDRLYRKGFAMAPDNSEKMEKAVLKVYKAERAAGIPHEDCKKTRKEIDKMLDYLQAYEKEARYRIADLRDFLPIVTYQQRQYELRRQAAKVLEGHFKDLAKVVLISPYNAEMVTYMLHSAEIAKLCTACAQVLGKMDTKFGKLAKEYDQIAAITHDQVFYLFGGDFFDDLPNRI